ncbi:MAG TPA: RagB/SusD family nutrient uptake outer membrane protein, partial [Chitinophagaceae bacterium]|nr:RagB/SusD family nutrient uptake outer membrane protein [Chitinophagaceae bacterium]
MKKNYLIPVMVLLVISVTSCRKKFLDQVPYNQIPIEQAIGTEADLQAALNGAYSQFRSINLYGRTIPLIGDLMADNVYIATVNSNRYIGEFNYAFTNQFGQSLNTFTDAYTGIQRVNSIINSNLPTSANVNQIRGEAFALRALLYFELVKLFGKPYTVDAEGSGVPLVLIYDPSQKPARKKVSEVYQQIEADLTEAANLVTSTTKNSSYVTKYAVKALQAKIAFYKGDYNVAKTFALDVVNNGGYSLVSSANYGAYWTNPAPVTTKVETIFEISFDGVTNAGINSLAYFYDQSGYGDAICTQALYDLYSATDVRRGRIVPGTRGGQSVLIVTKYPNTNNNSDKDDVKIMRYAELLLILAESYARTNDEANALTRLNQVALIRDPSFAGYASTGAALIEDIITERRKELAFEGNRYSDLARLNRDVVRINLNNNYPPSTPLTLPVTSHKRIWPIHQTELDINPNIA